MRRSEKRNRFQNLSASLLAGVSFLASGAAYGGVIEVGPGQSIQDAVNRANPGDTVRVAPGEYNAFEVKKDNITIESASPGAAHIVATGGNQPAIGSYGQSNVKIRGFRLTSRNGDGVKIGGSPGRNVRGVVFENNTVEYAKLDGLKFFQADNIAVSNNTIKQAGGGGNAGSAGNKNGDGGIDWVQISNSTMANNRVNTKGWACAMVKNGSHSNAITGNDFSGCEVNGLDMAAGSSGRAAAANKSGRVAFNNVIQGNVLSGGRGCAAKFDETSVNNKLDGSNRIVGRVCDQNGGNNASANPSVNVGSIPGVGSSGATTDEEILEEMFGSDWQDQLDAATGTADVSDNVLLAAYGASEEREEVANLQETFAKGEKTCGKKKKKSGGLFGSIVSIAVGYFTGGWTGAAMAAYGEATEDSGEEGGGGGGAGSYLGCPMIESVPGAIEIQATKTAVEAKLQTEEAVKQTDHQAKMRTHAQTDISWLQGSAQNYIALFGTGEVMPWNTDGVEAVFDETYSRDMVFQSPDDLTEVIAAQERVARDTSLESKIVAAGLAQDIEELSDQIAELEAERQACDGQTCVGDVTFQINAVTAQLQAKTALMQAAHNRSTEAHDDIDREARARADAEWNRQTLRMETYGAPGS